MPAQEHKLPPWHDDILTGGVDDYHYRAKVRHNEKEGYWWWDASVGGGSERERHSAHSWAGDKEEAQARAEAAVFTMLLLLRIENLKRPIAEYDIPLTRTS